MLSVKVFELILSIVPYVDESGHYIHAFHRQDIAIEEAKKQGHDVKDARHACTEMLLNELMSDL